MRRFISVTDNLEAATRIKAYRTIHLVFWVARLARYLYEVPRGLDLRLAARPVGWRAETEQKFQQYLQWAEASLA